MTFLPPFFKIPGDDDYRRGIYESLELGCVPVMLPRQRRPLEFTLGGVVRRAGVNLDEVVYFLPDNQIRDGTEILATLFRLASDPLIMSRRRQALFRAAKYLYFSTEEGDNLTLSLGLLMAGEHH